MRTEAPVNLTRIVEFPGAGLNFELLLLLSASPLTRLLFSTLLHLPNVHTFHAEETPLRSRRRR